MQAYLYKTSLEQALSDMDDDDLDGMILNDTEVEQKTAIWMEMNKDYLKDQAQKASDGGSDAKTQRPSRSRGKKGSSKQGETAGSAAEATKNMLEQRKLSKKINYDALESHFSAGTSSS